MEYHLRLVSKLNINTYRNNMNISKTVYDVSYKVTIISQKNLATMDQNKLINENTESKLFPVMIVL